MIKNRKLNLLIVLTLVVTMCAGAFSASFGETAADKFKEAQEAAKKAAEATKSFEEAEEKLGALQEEMKVLQGQIEETKKKMEKKQKEIKKQEGDLNQRLTAMYKTGTVGFVDVILSSQDIADLISNIGMVQKILESDQNLLEKLQDDYAELEKIKADLDEQEIALSAKQAETEALVEKFKAEADKYKAEEEQLLAEAQALAAEAARNASNATEQILANGGSIDTSNYSWPTTSQTITSAYGWRICPFHGKEFHNGIDIGGSTGLPIYAINDGIVTRASWYGGYGNCIILSCGGDISALYGHLSGFNCSQGDFVVKGTLIGYMGSTGNSTGPHLHFTVFLGSEAISPWSLY